MEIMTDKHTRIDEAIKAQRVRQGEVSKLYEELAQSLAIERIFPDAFEHGACKQSWNDLDIPAGGMKWPDGLRTVSLKVTRGDESVRTMLFEDLPEWFINELIVRRGIAGFDPCRYRGRFPRLDSKLSRVAMKNELKRRLRRNASRSK
jgi:hypothetical protein